MNRYATVLMIAAVLLAECSFGGGHVRKKIVALGWDVMWATPAQLLERSDEFANTGISGMIPTLSGELPDGTKISPRRLMHEPPWTEAAFAADEPIWTELLKKKGFTESFAGPLRMPTNRVAWTDDAWWGRVAGNMRVFGRVTRRFGFKGIEVDHEDYPRGKPFVRRPDDLPFRELAPIVRRRAREMFSPFFEEFPEAILFGCRFLSVDPDFWDYYCRCPDPAARIEEWGDLWPSFVNGILDAMPMTARLIEGDETGYRYEASRHDYFKAYARLNQALPALLAPESRLKYRAVSTVAFPVYLDMYSSHESKSRYYRGPVDGSRAAHCERNLSEAIDASDEYMWVYGERASWVHWPKPPDPRASLAAKTWDELMPGLFDVLYAKTDPCGYARKKLASLTEDEKSANVLKGVLEGAVASYKTPGFHATSHLPKPFHGWQGREQPGTFGVCTSEDGYAALYAEGVGRGGIMFSCLDLAEGSYHLVAFKVKGGLSQVIIRVCRENGEQELVEPPTWIISDDAAEVDGWRQVACIVRVPDASTGFMASACVKQKPGERTLLRDFHSAPVLNMR